MMIRQENIWDVRPQRTLAELLRWCTNRRHVDRVMFVCRLDNDVKSAELLSPSAEAMVFRLIGERMLRSTFAYAWPGTQLTGRGHRAKVFIGVFDEDLMSRISTAENNLRRWTHWNQPPLPEDLCLWRAGDQLPTLVSVTHDGDAWLLNEGKVDAHIAAPSVTPLPLSLIPPAPDFIHEAI